MFIKVIEIISGKNAKFHAIFAPSFTLLSLCILGIINVTTREFVYYPQPISNFARNELGGPIFQALILLPFVSYFVVYVKRYNEIKSVANFNQSFNSATLIIVTLASFFLPWTFVFPVPYNKYLHNICALAYFLTMTYYLWFNCIFSKYCIKYTNRTRLHRSLFYYRLILATLSTLFLILQFAVITYKLTSTYYKSKSNPKYIPLKKCVAWFQYFNIIFILAGSISYVFDMNIKTNQKNSIEKKL